MLHWKMVELIVERVLLRNYVLVVQTMFSFWVFDDDDDDYD